MSDQTRIAPARIALIGDYEATKEAHQGIPPSLDLAAQSLGCRIAYDWIETDELPGPDEGGLPVDLMRRLTPYDGIWVVPGSPYRNMAGALGAVRVARETGTAFLGTCGGFQHALIEFIRDVQGKAAADHAESNAAAEMPVIQALSCSLKGATGDIDFLPGSRLAAIYGKTRTTERYHCNYGFNTEYQPLIEGSALHFTGHDAEGAPRAFELAGHPFFIATLFQPERYGLRGERHPLITAFVAAAIAA